MLISPGRVVGLVKLVQKCSKINQQYGFWKKIWTINVCIFGCQKMHHSCLCDSAKNVSSRPLSQVVGKNLFGQSVCRFFLIFDMLKTIWKPIYFMVNNTYFKSMLFKIEFTQWIFYANPLVKLYMNMKLFLYFLRNYFQSTLR